MLKYGLEAINPLPWEQPLGGGSETHSQAQYRAYLWNPWRNEALERGSKREKWMQARVPTKDRPGKLEDDLQGKSESPRNSDTSLPPFGAFPGYLWGFPGGSTINNLPAMQETWV